MKLLTVDDARSRMLARARRLETETVPLGLCLGRALAAPVLAGRDQPPFAASAMDGWAVQAADTPGALTIVGESAAGHGFDAPLAPGQAVRIFTGAPLPAGADAVVIQEEARREGGRVQVPVTPARRHVRPAGQDFTAGASLLEAGVQVDPWRAALCAAAGRATLEVSRRPCVAIIATGEEIVAPGETPGRWQIFDSGSVALSGLVQSWGAESATALRVGDTAGAIRSAVADLACDVIVTLGGASVGDHDLVRPTLIDLGLELIVESVAVRPGKPTWFGVMPDGRLVLGLPGNPASALVCAELFLRPLLLALQGAKPELRLIRGRAGAPFSANGGRETWLRVRLEYAGDGGCMALPFADQDSGLVAVFAAADGLVRRPPEAPAAAVGDPVDVLPLARL